MKPRLSPSLRIALASIAVTTAYVLSMLSVTNGRFLPQVADLYLIAQYAKGLATGHPFQYWPGELPTTGATSLLHTLFLAAGHAVGFRGEGLIAFAILTGAIFMLLGALKIREAAQTLGASEDATQLAAYVVILNGPLGWSYHYGADISLVLYLSSWLFAAWVKGSQEGSSLSFVLPASLLAASRPEAAILVGLLGLFALSRREEPLSRRLAALAPAGVAVLVLGLLRFVTGAASGTSYSQKSLFASTGVFPASAAYTEYWTDVVRGLLLGFYPASAHVGLSGFAPFFAPPLLLLLVFPAALSPHPAARRAKAFLQAAFVTSLAVSATIHAGVHYQRYLLFALPALLCLAITELPALGSHLDRWSGAPSASSFRALRTVVLLLCLSSTVRFVAVYADDVSTVAQKDEAAIDFINAQMPADAAFLNNATAIEFRTGRRAINLSGVVSPEFTRVLPAETEAAAFEVLSRLGLAQLPPYLIANRDWIDQSGLSVLVGGPPIFETSSMTPPEIAIFPTTGRLLGLQLRPSVPPATGNAVLVDDLNVGDPKSEAEHGYAFVSGRGTRRFFAALKVDRSADPDPSRSHEIADGGRLIEGHESFEIRTPGQGDVLLLMRTNARPAVRVAQTFGEFKLELPLAQARFRVRTEAGTSDLMITKLEPGWNEVLVRIPAALAPGERTRLTLEGRYASYAYWAYRQPR